MYPENLEAVLFDAGGTLVRIDYAYVSHLAADLGVAIAESSLLRGEAAARHAIDARARVLGTVEGTDATRIVGYFETLLRAAGVPEPSVAPLVQAMEQGHRRSNLWRVPLQGAVDTLRRLRERGIKTAIVSNGDGRIRERLVLLGIAEHVAFVLDSSEEGVEKPDPEIFHRALARLGVSPGRAAYIGDIYSIDAIGARAAGLCPILVDPTGGYDEIDCHTIADLSELVDALPRVASG